MGHDPVIAIDGPSGSGKSTLAKSLAERLQLLYIDTGAMFRALAYEADRLQIKPQEGPEMSAFLHALKLSYGHQEGRINLKIDQRDVTEVIREHRVSKLASIFSTLAPVRRFLLSYQRELARNQVCVMEGRDIGTVVFPEAFCKLFISASVEERARRRWDQLKGQKRAEEVPTLEQVMDDVRKRDEADTNRAEAPLKQAQDALYVDTSEMDLDQALEYLVKLVRERAALKGVPLP